MSTVDMCMVGVVHGLLDLNDIGVFGETIAVVVFPFYFVYTDTVTRLPGPVARVPPVQGA